MRQFLDEYITSLTKHRQERIYDLLAAAQIGKSDLDEVANQLVDLRISAPLMISLEAYAGLISSSKLDASYHDALQHLTELFQASNLISLLLDSHTAVLTSEIKTIEDEINAIEKAISNYAFALEENGAYDFVYSETFSDHTMEDTSSFLLPSIPDRDGTDFQEEQLCYINSNSGILTLDPDIEKAYAIVGEVIQHNCLNYVKTETDLAEAFNANSGSGWKVNISSPRPISTTLVSGAQVGAQVKIRAFLPAPSPCDSVIFTPLADNPVWLLGVDVFPGEFDAAEGISVLSEPLKIEQPHLVSFPLQSISAFEFTISQPIYQRDKLPAAHSEELYRQVYEKVKVNKQVLDERNEISDYPTNLSALRRVFLRVMGSTSLSNKLHVYKTQFPTEDFTFSSGPISFTSNARKQKGDLSVYKDQLNDVLRRMIYERLFASNPQILNDRQLLNVSTAFISNADKLNAGLVSGQDQSYPRESVDTPIDATSIANTGQGSTFDYRYSLGLKNVEIGTGVRSFKGVYISKTLPSPTSVDDVKIKVDYTNYDLVGSARDDGRITSVEFYVTNKSNPVAEQDWIPILPIDETSVWGERAFFNEAGVCWPRFPISVVDEFKLFRNGFEVPSDLLSYNLTEDLLGIQSFRLPLNQITITDIFTINYTPYGPANSVNFAERGFDNQIVASAFDETGGGETFSGTADNNSVTLRYTPFVDYDLVNQFGGYNSSVGFTGTYQPITVMLDTGVVASNFTNYKGITQTELSLVPSSTIGYLHSGNRLIFNQAVDRKFTVFYQFLPSDLRFKVLMRCNSIEYVSPILNTIQLKAKTRKPDVRQVMQ